MKYVNMADINFNAALTPAQTDAAPLAGGGTPDTLRWDIIELLFFSYRDFVGDADHVLEAFGFGRAHHRVLYFVQRYPGLTVADLLGVLRITKQSLGRVLKQLLDEDYIVQKEGETDRRQRLLYATPKGEMLVARLVELQTERIERALRGFSAQESDVVRNFLRRMIDHDNPDKVLAQLMDASLRDAGGDTKETT